MQCSKLICYALTRLVSVHKTWEIVVNCTSFGTDIFETHDDVLTCSDKPWSHIDVLAVEWLRQTRKWSCHRWVVVPLVPVRCWYMGMASLTLRLCQRPLQFSYIYMYVACVGDRRCRWCDKLCCIVFSRLILRMHKYGLYSIGIVHTMGFEYVMWCALYMGRPSIKCLLLMFLLSFFSTLCGLDRKTCRAHSS